MNAQLSENRKNRSNIDTRFKPGNKGKPKGATSKVTRTLRESILLAAAQAGNKLKPGSGLVGYLQHLAETEPKTFGGLIGRTLPLDVTSSDGSMRPVVQVYMPSNARDVIDVQAVDVTPCLASPAEGPQTAAMDVVEPMATAADGTQAQPQRSPANQEAD